MTPEVKKMELEQLRDEILQHRLVVVEAYKIRKWLDCKKISEDRLKEFLNLLRNNQDFPWNTLEAVYRAEASGYGRIAVLLYSETRINASINVPPRNPQKRNFRPNNKV